MKPKLYFSDTVTDKNECVVNISVDNFVDIAAFNITINYDLEIVEVTPPQHLHSKEGFLASHKEEGQIKFGWFTYPAINLPDKCILLQLICTKKKSGTSFLKFKEDFGLSNSSWDTVETDYINGILTFKKKQAMKTHLTFEYCPTEDIQLKKGNKFMVPFKTTTPLVVSAISLMVEYPEDFLKVNRVGIPDPGGEINVVNFSFDTIVKDQVIVGWFAANPTALMNLPNIGDTLLSMEFEVVQDFAEGQELALTPTDIDINELAGADFNGIPLVTLMVSKYKNVSSMPAPPEPVFPPNSKVAERKAVMNYKGKQTITKKCSTCKRGNEGRCVLGNFRVAKGGICDYYV